MKAEKQASSRMKSAPSNSPLKVEDIAARKNRVCAAENFVAPAPALVGLGLGANVLFIAASLQNNETLEEE